MDRNELFNFIQEIAADLSKGSVIFPTSFDTTMKLRELFRSENASARDVADVVKHDPLLASKIIQASNSAAINPSGQPITAVPAAVTRMGFNTVKTLALSITMQQLRTYREMARYDQLCEHLMAHSRHVAAIAFVLARQHTRISPDTAMFAGLVHDIGLFYLVYRIAGRADIVLEDEEMSSLLSDWHGSIGHAVLSVLGMPEEILEAVANHDEPRPVERIRDLNDLVFVSNRIAKRLEPGGAVIEWSGALADDTLIRDFDVYVATVKEKHDDISSIMHLV